MAKYKSKFIGLDKLKGRPIRLNQIVLPVKPSKDYAEMIYAGDVHYGSPEADIPRFKRMLQYCALHRIYIFLTGDLLEVGTRDSIGDSVYTQLMNTDDQYEEMLAILEPYAKQGLIVGLLQGNHEERIWKQSGVNISRLMAKKLNIPYLHNACWNVIRVGKQTYTAYTLHGRTGARFDGTALLALERISTSFFADMVVMGHAHKLISSAVVIQRVHQNKRVIEHKKHLIIAGSYLMYDRSYAQTAGLPLSKLGSPKVKLRADKHDIFVSY